MQKSGVQQKREAYKAEFWPNEIAWTGEKPEAGWFRAPRTLSLILELLSREKVTGSKADPGRVYLELFTRHRDSGVIDMATEGEHSYAAGYSGARGGRTWTERMKLLEKLGFIKSHKSGNQPYKLVMLVHPTIAVHRLNEQGLVDAEWWQTYRKQQIDAKEPSFDELMARHQPDKVVPIRAVKKAAARGPA